MTERGWTDGVADGFEADGSLVIAQAETEAEAVGRPRALVPDEAPESAASEPAAPQADTPEDATAAATPAPADGGAVGGAVGAADGGIVDVEPLAAGERRVIEVAPGSTVVLASLAFDPASAVYAVDGLDLVVTQPNGGVLVLAGFFAPTEAPPQLSVLGAPATAAPVLLQQAEAAPLLEDQSAVEPAAGPADGPPPGGGGAGFSAYEQGMIGDGLSPLGPLGPTSLAYSAPTQEVTSLLVGDDDNGSGDSPPPPAAPEVTLRSTVAATVGEELEPGYNPVTTPVLPIRGNGLSIPGDEVNGADQRNLTLDMDREVFVRFVNEDSVSINSLFVHDIAPDGTITNVRLVFDGVNKPGDPLTNLKETPLGTEFPLGTVAAGTEIGLVLVNDGFRLNDFASLEGGHYIFRNPNTGEPSTIYDNHRDDQPYRQPRLFHVADDGTETQIQGTRFFTADASQQTTNNNRLNPDKVGHVVSGWDAENGVMTYGFEDNWSASSDRDFDDLQIAVRFGSPTQNVLVLRDFDNGVEAAITDADSTEMASATITLTGLAGDSLLLDPAVAAGTGITVTQVSDSLIELQGLAPIAAYEQVINAASIAVDVDNPQYGDRQIEVAVEDPEGNTGTATTTISVDDSLIVGPDGGGGDDTIVGTPGDDVISGRAGNDDIDGNGGSDFVSGGDGQDTIDVRQPGQNTIIGGPEPDLILLGDGADTVVITGLADGTDTISGFDATEGDRLDLSLLFRDSDITAGTIDDFVRTTGSGGDVTVQVDLDGPCGNSSFVDIAVLQNPTGVTAGTDPSSFVITPGSDTPVT